MNIYPNMIYDFIKFFVDNLKILAYGKIKNQKIIARKEYNIHNSLSINPVEITAKDTFYYDNKRPKVGLNFTPISIRGKINVKDILYVQFVPNLSISDVIFCNNYLGRGFINLGIEYLFEVTTKVYSLKI